MAKRNVNDFFFFIHKKACSRIIFGSVAVAVVPRRQSCFYLYTEHACTPGRVVRNECKNRVRSLLFDERERLYGTLFC